MRPQPLSLPSPPPSRPVPWSVRPPASDDPGRHVSRNVTINSRLPCHHSRLGLGLLTSPPVPSHILLLCVAVACSSLLLSCLCLCCRRRCCSCWSRHPGRSIAVPLQLDLRERFRSGPSGQLPARARASWAGAAGGGWGKRAAPRAASDGGVSNRARAMRPTPARGGGRAAFLLVLVLLAAAALAPRRARAVTDAADVTAINGLYVSLGSPKLPGWVPNGGDPCGEVWQGVTCTGTSITSIKMNVANLGGQLGSLGNFTAITTIDLSNNNIGGTIPEDLPLTLQNLFLSDNQLTGSIPSSLSKLTSLSAMSLNANHLDGELPDSFDSLVGLINLDMSSNNFTGILPPSMQNLSSLTTLRIQDNQLSGTLNALQDLPLKDLNVENNLFSGLVPPKLLNIPTFKMDGNPFNTTTIAPSASPPSASAGPAPIPTPTGPKQAPTPTTTPTGLNPTLAPPSPPSKAPPPSNSSGGSTTRDSTSSSNKNKSSTLKIVGFVLLGVVLFIAIALLVIFCLSKYQERQSRYDYNRSQLGRVRHRVEPQALPASVQPWNDVKKGSGESLDKRGRELSIAAAAAVPKKPAENRKEHIINLDRTDSELFAAAPPRPPPPPPPPLPPAEKVVNPIVPPEKRYSPPPKTSTSNSATPFSVASLQQYTSNFREQNVIRESRLGKVYLAELPEGKLMEVMKIDNANGRVSIDDFLDLVARISEIKNPNILELVGYCAEYGQRLLVYNHFSRKTLDDALHDREETDNALSWNARLQVALGSGKALQYLHENVQPPIVHQNFEPENVLLDNKLSVCVAECGLAELMPSSSVTQLSGRMRTLLNYEAPELQESRIISERGDVYSFGVVMLELLTGRKPYDSSRPRHEQHLVRWAGFQLHDIESLSKMVDPPIRGQFSEKALSRFADIISRCIQREPEFRPPMSAIVQDLASIVNASGEDSE